MKYIGSPKKERVFDSSYAGVIVELVEDLDVAGEVTDGLDQENSAGHRVHATLPVLVRRVVGGRLPVGH